jgi:hypothetical protein
MSQRIAAGVVDVICPGHFSAIRAALSSCAIEGNQFAIDALETIRRAEVGEPVGLRYAERLNRFMRIEEEALNG